MSDNEGGGDSRFMSGFLTGFVVGVLICIGVGGTLGLVMVRSQSSQALMMREEAMRAEEVARASAEEAQRARQVAELERARLVDEKKRAQKAEDKGGPRPERLPEPRAEATDQPGK